MDFIRAFLTSGLEMIVLAAVIVGGILVGKKLRDNKDAKDAANQ